MPPYTSVCRICLYKIKAPAPPAQPLRSAPRFAAVRSSRNDVLVMAPHLAASEERDLPLAVVPALRCKSSIGHHALNGVIDQAA